MGPGKAAAKAARRARRVGARRQNPTWGPITVNTTVTETNNGTNQMSRNGENRIIRPPESITPVVHTGINGQGQGRRQGRRQQGAARGAQRVGRRARAKQTARAASARCGGGQAARKGRQAEGGNATVTTNHPTNRPTTASGARSATPSTVWQAGEGKVLRQQEGKAGKALARRQGGARQGRGRQSTECNGTHTQIQWPAGAHTHTQRQVNVVRSMVRSPRAGRYLGM